MFGVKPTLKELGGGGVRGRPAGIVSRMEGLGQSREDAWHRNKWRRKIKGQPANRFVQCVFMHSLVYMILVNTG